MRKLLATVMVALLPTLAMADMKVIVPFAAGGATDTLARKFAIFAEKTTGENITVENVVGAGSAVGTKRLLESTGNIFMVNTGSFFVNIAQGTFGLSDFKVASVLSEAPQLLGVLTSKKHTCQSLRNTTADIFIGTAGKDSISSVPAGFLTERSKNFIEVPYKGINQATLDLLGGRIDIVFFSGFPGDRPEVTMLANTGPSTFEGVPSLKECLGINKTVTTQFLIVANKNADQEFVKRLNDLAAKFANSAEGAVLLKERGMRPIAANLETTRKLVEEQQVFWSKIYSK